MDNAKSVGDKRGESCNVLCSGCNIKTHITLCNYHKSGKFMRAMSASYLPNCQPNINVHSLLYPNSVM